MKKVEFTYFSLRPDFFVKLQKGWKLFHRQKTPIYYCKSKFEPGKNLFKVYSS